MQAPTTTTLPAVDPRIRALNDEQLVQSANAAVESYREVLDHYSRSNRGAYKRLEQTIPEVLDDLLNECAVRGLEANKL